MLHGAAVIIVFPKRSLCGNDWSSNPMTSYPAATNSQLQDVEQRLLKVRQAF
jgi:hypothetical protein